ncbi:MAG: hypothetical protein ACOC41_06725 [Chitinivibrionales bacterium]
MNTLLIVFFLLLLSAGGAAIIRYIRHYSGPHALILLSLRIGTLILIALVFFQPKLRFSRLLPPHRKTAVLVDVSESMNLFDTDSIIDRIVYTIDSLQGKGSAGKRMPVFAFGDSLRPLSGLGSIGYIDRHSRFPDDFSEPSLKNAANILLISDGNWSDFETFSSLLQNKDVRYIPLRMKRYEPFVEQNATISPNRSLAGTRAEADIVLSGYRTARDTIHVSVTSEAFQADTSIVVDSGFFDDSLVVSIPATEPGTRLYKIKSRSETDSAPTVSYATHETVAKKVRVAFVGKHHSLDKRFLGMALERHQHVELVSISELRDGDLALFLDCSQKNRGLFSSLPPSISVVCVGDMPCARKQEEPSGTLKIETESSFDAEYGMAARSLPPPAVLLSCSSLPAQSTIMTARLGSGERLPLFYEAVYSNRRIMILSARGIWRWDFWPSTDARQNTKTFSSFFIDRVLSFARRNANRSFFSYPDPAPVTETDSIRWRMSIPASIQMQSSETKIDMRLERGSRREIDTSFTIENYGAASVRIAQPPLQADSYPYYMSIEADTGTMIFRDTLHVHRNNREMRVHGLNTRMLEQIASQLTLRPGREFGSFVSGKDAGDITVQQSFTVRRNWWTLMLLIVLLCSEWLVRRLWRFD